MKRQVYNKKTDKKIPSDAVYVGRPTKWGNPFIATENRREDNCLILGLSRQSVVDMFNLYACHRLVDEPHWLDALRGRPLICFCYPKACHASVLWHLSNKMPIVEENIIREENGYKLVECYNYKIPPGVYEWKFPNYALRWYELRCSKTGIIVYSHTCYTSVNMQEYNFSQKKGKIENAC